MKFKKKTEVTAEIPTASLPDIIFMLLFFFMVTTVLKTVTGLQVELPEAEKIQKIESRRHTSYLWIDRTGEMQFDDRRVLNERMLYELAYNKRVSDPQVIVSLKYDKRVKMGDIFNAQDQLRKAETLKVNFATMTKSR